MVPDPPVVLYKIVHMLLYMYAQNVYGTPGSGTTIIWSHSEYSQSYSEYSQSYPQYSQEIVVKKLCLFEMRA